MNLFSVYLMQKQKDLLMDNNMTLNELLIELNTDLIIEKRGNTFLAIIYTHQIKNDVIPVFGFADTIIDARKQLCKALNDREVIKNGIVINKNNQELKLPKITDCLYDARKCYISFYQKDECK
jgi:hypothetical protein